MSIIRVVVADDSVVFRTLMRDVLDSQSGIEVVSACTNGEQAVKETLRLKPDVIVMDAEMPVLDGISALKQIHAADPAMNVVMCSAFTTSGARLTLDALSAGARGFVAKPASGTPRENIALIESELVPLIRSLAADTQPSSADSVSRIRVKTPTDTLKLVPAGRDVIAIAISTGGPRALADFLPGLPGDFPVPILIVQHMPPEFTKQLALRLDKACAIGVVEAEQGMAIEPGRAYIAPGDMHMEVERVGGAKTIRLHQGERENSCRPSADPLFRSVAKAWGQRACALVMTGMGNDGVKGCEAIRSEFGAVIVQDLESSVVWGMPGAVVEHGLADAVVRLTDLAEALVVLTKRKEP